MTIDAVERVQRDWGETLSRANVSRLRKRLGINQDNSFARNARLKFERLAGTMT